MKLEFNNKVYKNNYAIVYTVLQRILFPGFVLCIVIVFSSAVWHYTFTLPDVLTYILTGYLVLSLFGFPIVSAIKKGYKNLLIKSILLYKPEEIYFERVTENEWTAIGHVNERKISQIKNVTNVKTTRFNYIIYGEIHQKIINNGRELKRKTVDKVKIPIAYSNMEGLIKNE